LALLALRPKRFLSREAVLDVLWPDAGLDRAKKSLNSAVWRARAYLGDAGHVLESTRDGQLSLQIDPESVDFVRMEALVSPVLRSLDGSNGPLQAEQVTRLEGGVELYRGDLLEDVYDDWAIAERQHARTLVLRSLRALLNHWLETDVPSSAEDVASTLLRLDPADESAHRELMRLHARGGKRTLAIRQYEQCREDLARELASRPDDETRTLMRAIVNGEPSSPAANRHPKHILRSIEADIARASILLEEAVTLYRKARACLD
jgi:DNA-binding SARP family transcriptional activator